WGRCSRDLAIQVGEAELEGLVGFLESGVIVKVGGLGQSLGAGVGGPIGRQFELRGVGPARQDLEGSFLGGLDLQHQGSRAGEVAEQPLAVLVSSAESPGVAVYPQ